MTVIEVIVMTLVMVVVMMVMVMIVGDSFMAMVRVMLIHDDGHGE
jgi:hypothetical protein